MYWETTSVGRQYKRLLSGGWLQVTISSANSACNFPLRVLHDSSYFFGFWVLFPIYPQLSKNYKYTWLELDHCNSIFLNLPKAQLGRLQLILNSSAWARPVSRRRISGLAAEKSSAEYQPWKIRLAGLAAGKSQPNISCKLFGGRNFLNYI